MRLDIAQKSMQQIELNKQLLGQLFKIQKNINLNLTSFLTSFITLQHLDHSNSYYYNWDIKRVLLGNLACYSATWLIFIRQLWPVMSGTDHITLLLSWWYQPRTISAYGLAKKYKGNTKVPTKDLITMKILLNSVLSTPGAKFIIINIKNFYLETSLKNK